MPTPPEPQVLLEARRHGVVLARPFAKALVLAACGAGLVALGWSERTGTVPWLERTGTVPGWVGTVPGGLLLALAALVAARAAWRWERTRLVVTTDELVVVAGTLRRRSATVPLRSMGAVEVEQTVPGRLLGYGTLLAGDLELAYVPDPDGVSSLLSRRAPPPSA